MTLPAAVRQRRRRVAMAGIATVAVAISCAQPPRPVGAADLSDAERRYGLAPKANGAVVYQPDVVIVSGGAEAVRSVSSDGLTWTLKSARAADHLELGKIMFVTGRGVGRVLAISDTADGRAVTLGPVELTDVIKDAEISFDAPIDLSNAVVNTAPDFPGGATVEATSVAGLWRDGPPRFAFLRIAAPTVHRFRVVPYAGAEGIGLRMSSDAGGVRIVGEVVVHLKLPNLRFNLIIRGGKVLVAELQLDGAAGFMARLEVASDVGVRGNLNETVAVPVDFSVPIAGLPVPLALTARQTFIMRTAFSAKGGLQAKGSFAVSGGFRLGYRNGQFGLSGPHGFTIRESFIKSVDGVSLGPAGVVLAYQAKVIVGIGAFGFATGPYVGFNTSTGITRGSDLGLIVCKGATLDLSMVGGIGYVMPQPVTDAINTVLRALNIGEIKGEGGLQAPRLALLNRSETVPKVKLCEG